MTIQAGDRLPDGTLTECTEFDPATNCPLNPQSLAVQDLIKGKKIVIFAVPGAFTPTCSIKHLPGYVKHYEAFKAKGVDEIWCLSVNDAFVMAAWGRDQHVNGKVRLLADGSALYTTQLGLSQDLTAKGLGVRSLRYALIVEDGVVKHVAVEAPSKFEVSNAEAILAAL
ncbi:peroxiredoxin [Methylococcus sp. EFPC2]|uniref:peroxiredoxin n=1 Tax=Methylococcus sp. EFPC2 TaxID=2812648 RepID=UPI001966EFBE|nr:peroxiredoxin [Methylococcus sp. EFPC2]QSA96271.1 peroxiredoxin [Methylococcus sp. EFPC2]